jgi:pilus assembly protein CpaE
VAELTFVVYSEQDEFGSEIRARLLASGHVHVAAVVSEAEDLVAAVREHAPDLLFADLGIAPHDALDLLDCLPAPRPALVVCGPQDDSQLILRAMKQGAKEFFPPEPSREAIRQLIDRLVLENRPALRAGRLAPVLAVMGAKGGVGATVVACQLAAALQACGGRTVLVDLNYPLGDVALHFDMRPTYTLAHVVKQGEELDATYLRGLLQGHRSGVQILAAPERVEEAELVRGAHVERVISILRQEFAWVVLDVSRSWNEASVRALDLASEILLITSLDVPTLNHARQHLDLLRRLGHSDAKIHPIANRYSKRDAVTDKEFAVFLGRSPDLHLPNDYPSTVGSVNEGRPLGEVAPRSALHLAFVSLAKTAHAWSGIEVGASGAEPENLAARMRRLFKKVDHGTA